VIRILRPEEPPRILAEQASSLVREMLAQYRADPQAYRDGTKVFEFKRAVYGHPEVKQRLLEAQRGKCCYCEISIVSEPGDIEHFRPKARVCQGDGEPMQAPGYFWLAYTWSNLLYACSRCNREHKRDLFPLEAPAARADAARDGGSTAGEAPLLLDPAVDDPEAHVEFDEERALPRNGARRGRVTIDLIDLNRTKLLEARREALEPVRTRVDALRLVRAGKISMDSPEGQSFLRRLCREILDAVEPRAAFAGMTRCAVQRWLAPELSFPCSEEQLAAWALAGAERAAK
jgi:uncharacterized protein (TIGR02646 family)